jgi:hypothetical protein
MCPLLGEAVDAVAAVDADVGTAGTAAVVADAHVADREEIIPPTSAETQETFGTATTSLT